MEALCILIVEDDAIIGKFLSEMLEAMGHTVCAVEAGEAGAVTAASRCRPGLMIVDVALADGSGISAVVEILKNGFVPHFFITGDARDVRAKLPDAIVVQKPFFEAQLGAAIAAALAVTNIASTPAH